MKPNVRHPVPSCPILSMKTRNYHGKKGRDGGIEEVDRVIGEHAAAFEGSAQEGVGKIADETCGNDQNEMPAVYGSNDSGAGETEKQSFYTDHAIRAAFHSF